MIKLSSSTASKKNMPSTIRFIWVGVAFSTMFGRISDCFVAERADAGLYMVPMPSEITKFRIGGWGPGEKEANFLERYKPIFQDYLTEVVGPLYSPPISFEFITTDWSSDETKTSHIMIEEGTIDFTCEAP